MAFHTKSTLPIRNILCFISLVYLASCTKMRSIPSRPDQLGLKKIDFHIPQVDEWKLANGMTVYFYLNDDVPQVRGKIFFPGGSFNDPSGIGGLASATGEQMREGSIPGFTPDELDKKLDSMAASIESSFAGEFGSVSCFSLVEDFEEVFRLFSEVVRTPAFSPTRLSLWKIFAGEGIRRRRDDPATMALMTFTDLVYGLESPYAREVDYDSIKSITVERMREFHERFVRPDGARLVITGAISKEEVKRLVEQYFGDWTPGIFQRPSLPPISHLLNPGVYILERDFDQATVLIGHRGPKRLTPDQYAMSIYNRVFGHGGFGSVLFREIRSRLGLAYSVVGGLYPGPEEGVFQVELATRSSEALNAIRETLELTKRSRTELPDQKNFDDAKSSVERSFVFKFADPGYLVERAAMLDLLGYPKDFDETYLSHIESVSPEDTRAVAQTWVKPEEAVIIIVGRIKPEEVKKAFGSALEVYPVTFDAKPLVGEKLVTAH